MEGVKTIITLLGDPAAFFWLTLRPQSTLAAENLFLRKQLAMFQERKARPRRPDTPIRIALVLLSRLFNWRDALVVVQPQTLVRWDHQGIRLFCRWKSRPGRPPIVLPENSLDTLSSRQPLVMMMQAADFWELYYLSKCWQLHRSRFWTIHFQ
jgi:hypothetical protein